MVELVVAVLVGLIVGVGLWAFGLRLFLVLLPIWGFVAGFWLAARGVSLYLNEAFLASPAGIIAGLILGLLFGALAYFNFELGLALVTAVVGVTLTVGVLEALGLATGLLVVVVSVGVAIGLVHLLYRYELDHYLIMTITALGGGSLLIATGLMLAGRLSIADLTATGNVIAPVLADSWLWLVALLVLAVVGVFAQLRTSRDFMFDMRDLVQGWN